MPVSIVQYVTMNIMCYGKSLLDYIDLLLKFQGNDTEIFSLNFFMLLSRKDHKLHPPAGNWTYKTLHVGALKSLLQILTENLGILECKE
jgi:hypothetical protein